MNMNQNKNITSTIYEDDLNRILLNFIAENKEIKVYLVGGYIRDLLLGRNTIDKDYCILGLSGIRFAEKFSEQINGHFVILDEDNDIARVVLEDKENHLDFAGCVGENINEDLARRDFTINAMAFYLNDTEDNQIIDPYNGQQDLKLKLIRSISEQNIIDDPLRILRAYRIAGLIKGTIEEKTLEEIIKHKELLKTVAFERVQVELNKLFNENESFKYIEKMANEGILETLIPEMKDLRKVPTNVYHHLGLFEHTLEVYKQIELLIPQLDERTLSHLNENLCLSTTRIAALKYSALLHDIAKPKTWVIDNTGKHTFLGHADQGSEMAEIIAKKLKLPGIIIKAIKKLVKYHLYPSQLSHNFEPPSKKSTHRFFIKLESEAPEAIILAIADRKSAVGPKISDEIVNRNINMLNELLEKYYNYLDQENELPKLLDGNDIMNILNIKPSKLVGEILEELRYNQLEGNVKTPNEAKFWVLNNYKNLNN